MLRLLSVLICKEHWRFHVFTITCYYRPQTKLWEGYVFTPVCDSVPTQCMLGYTHLPAQCMLGYTPRQILWDTVNKRAVRIPLECILVYNCGTFVSMCGFWVAMFLISW